MSEQQTIARPARTEGYMVELDQWTDTNVVKPLLDADPYEPDNLAGGNVSELQTAVEAVKKAIRTKVLESYRNGQAAGPRKAERREV